MCTQQKGQLVCKMAAEDRDAYENDIADLQARVKKLEAQVAAMGKVEGSKASALPSEQEFEQSMSYMERFMRRFMDLAKSFESGEEKPAPPQYRGGPESDKKRRRSGAFCKACRKSTTRFALLLEMLQLIRRNVWSLLDQLMRMMLGSVTAWPLSSTILRSASGHIFFNCQALMKGVQIS